MRVAHACSGNLMKHLKSRHVREFVLTQAEWDKMQEVIIIYSSVAKK